MVSKKQDILSKEKLEQFEKLVQMVGGLDIKEGFGFPYCSINGNMFCFMAKTGSVGIRLPKEMREQFLKKYNTVLFENHKGPIMKEYVQVPDELMNQLEILVPYVKSSFEFVKTLKPKPSKNN